MSTKPTPFWKFRTSPARIDPKKLNRSFAGRTFDAAFLAELPVDVDPCGENGEFHTLATLVHEFTGTGESDALRP